MKTRSFVVEDINHLNKKLSESDDDFTPKLAILFNSTSHDCHELQKTLLNIPLSHELSFIGASSAGEIALKSGE